MVHLGGNGLMQSALPLPRNCNENFVRYLCITSVFHVTGGPFLISLTLVYVNLELRVQFLLKSCMELGRVSGSNW
jgi:hypothetical protein